MQKRYLLIINPGSTSTKLGIYEETNLLFDQTLRYSSEDILQYAKIFDQFAFRKASILKALEEQGIDLNELRAVVGRGGVIKPIASGTYSISDALCEDLRNGVQGEHASNLGGLIARDIADELGIPSYIVDPVVVDELDEVARISGNPDIHRRSIFHALNHKAVARRAAKELGKPYEELNLIVAHLGGGISVGAHQKGKVIDVNNALNGEGPFSPERSGGLPAGDLVHLVLTLGLSEAEWQKKIAGKGGMVAYLGTNDGREVAKRIATGDVGAKLIYEALAYQVAKEIGSCAAVLKGQIDAILLTGGLAYDEFLVDFIKDRVSFLGDIKIYPGEDELLALAEGALRVLDGKEQVQQYV